MPRRFPAILLSLLAACSGPGLVICDQSEARVAILDASEDWSKDEAITWEWRARETDGLPEEARPWFEHPTDAKPVLGGEYLLITASGGGVALLRVHDQALLFQAYAGGNPHSAELLPDGGVVTASSTGNLLQCWRMEQPDQPVQQLTLADAHGVCWDPHTSRLWALGGRELVALSYQGKDAEVPLAIVERYDLPDPGGHDLARSAQGWLMLTTHAGAWNFDPRRPGFLPYGELASLPDLKSISDPIRLPARWPTVFVAAEESWWSDTVRSTDPDWTRTLPGAQIYKARWMYEPARAHEPPRVQFSIGFGAWLGVDPD